MRPLSCALRGILSAHVSAPQPTSAQAIINIRFGKYLPCALLHGRTHACPQDDAIPWTEPRLTACRPQKASFSWIRYRKKACCPQKAPFLWTRYQGKACHPQNAPNPWTVYEKFAGQHTCAIGFSFREGNNADKNIIKSAPE